MSRIGKKAIALPKGVTASVEGQTVPGRTTTRVHATAELEDGQTMLIGGIKSQGDDTVLLVTVHLIQTGCATCGPRAEKSVTEGAPATLTLRALEERLQKAQQEIDEIHREIRALNGLDTGGCGSR